MKEEKLKSYTEIESRPRNFKTSNSDGMIRPGFDDRSFLTLWISNS